jgi:hypothetical protein
MIYLLEFLGFLGIAVLLAATPLLARTVEYLRAHLNRAGRETEGYAAFQARTAEKSEIRDEIRRMTTLLEADRRGGPRDPHA